jgi:hypothetical protein
MNEAAHHNKRDQALHSFCEAWAHWHRSRRLFAPPVPANILARLQSHKVLPPPDAVMSADFSYFNLAILAQPESDEKMAFYLFYIYRLRNIKRLAAEMNVTRDAFYKRVKRFSEAAYHTYQRIVNEKSVDTRSIQNSTIHNPALLYDF